MQTINLKTFDKPLPSLPHRGTTLRASGCGGKKTKPRSLGPRAEPRIPARGTGARQNSIRYMMDRVGPCGMRKPPRAESAIMLTYVRRELPRREVTVFSVDSGPVRLGGLIRAFLCEDCSTLLRGTVPGSRFESSAGPRPLQNSFE
jgi:hypothetical protein